MKIRLFLSPDSKLLAILDQGISSGMSFMVMFLVTDLYSLRIIAILNLVGNISYSFATIVKSQLLYSSLLHKENSNRNSDLSASKMLIPKLQFIFILSTGIAVFLISNSRIENYIISVQMCVYFIGIFLTDFFRNVLIHNGLRLVSLKLNILSALALTLFVKMPHSFPHFFDLIFFWVILQFIFPFFILVRYLNGKIIFQRGMKIERLTGSYFLIEGIFSRLAMVVGSLYIFYSNIEAAGVLAVGYLIFAALPSLIASALQPISNGLVIRNMLGKSFSSVILITYVIHAIWLPIVFLATKLLPNWFPTLFQSAQEWGTGIVLASMTTAFLNLYQIRMLSDLGGLNFLISRFLTAILTGPVGALVIINLGVDTYNFYTLILLFILNPFSYQLYLRFIFLLKSKRCKEY